MFSNLCFVYSPMIPSYVLSLGVVVCNHSFQSPRPFGAIWSNSGFFFEFGQKDSERRRGNELLSKHGTLAGLEACALSSCMHTNMYIHAQNIKNMPKHMVVETSAHTCIHVCGKTKLAMYEVVDARYTCIHVCRASKLAMRDIRQEIKGCFRRMNTYIYIHRNHGDVPTST
jgi:hypothetical protein